MGTCDWNNNVSVLLPFAPLVRFQCKLFTIISYGFVAWFNGAWSPLRLLCCGQQYQGPYQQKQNQGKKTKTRASQPPLINAGNVSHTLARRQSGSNLFFGRPKTSVSSCIPQPWVPPSAQCHPVPPPHPQRSSIWVLFSLSIAQPQHMCCCTAKPCGKDIKVCTFLNAGREP